MIPAKRCLAGIIVFSLGDSPLRLVVSPQAQNSANGLTRMANSLIGTHFAKQRAKLSGFRVEDVAQ